MDKTNIYNTGTANKEIWDMAFTDLVDGDDEVITIDKITYERIKKLSESADIPIQGVIQALVSAASVDY